MITDNQEYYDQTFDALSQSESTISNASFENCKFLDCHFDDSTFQRCKFVDCTFKSCSMNLIKLTSTSFNEVEFFDCKLTGVNWSGITLPLICITSPLHFISCDLSFSSFYELCLPELTLSNCKAKDVDFRLVDLTNANLSNSDLEKAQFLKTNLTAADLRDAVNYVINPMDNKLTKAKFSYPEAVNLLLSFGIEVE